MKKLQLRERATQYGVGGLENDELVAIVLGHSDRERAKQLLENAGGMERLAIVGPDEHRRTPRVGIQAATRLTAAVELGRRTTIAKNDERKKMNSPRTSARYLLPRYGAAPTEQMGILSLNTRHYIVRDTVLTRGTIDRAAVSPRDVFRTALLSDASAIILWHNHPSGDPTPSEDDMMVTEQLRSAGDLVNIQLLDHIVVAAASYYSFQEHGRM